MIGGPVVKIAALAMLPWVFLGCVNDAVESSERQLELHERPAESSTGVPTTWRLVLQVDDEHLRLVQADPRRGSLRPVNPRDFRTDFLEGRSRLVAYSGLAVDGTLLVDGWIVVPLVAVAEFQHLEIDDQLQRDEQVLSAPTIRVAVPYDPAIRSIAFDALLPNPETDYERWLRVPLGVAELPETETTPEIVILEGQRE